MKLTPGFSGARRTALGMALVCLSLALGGCATKAPDADGAAALELDGPFRGRWWNYYERGRAYQQRGDFVEAERDLRVALRARGKDSLWPRTYGMHFIPEYFPHRELGVNLYYQGNLDGAIDLLETSLDQQFSARAAHYYRLAQQKRLEASGNDSGPPSLEVLTGRDALSATQIEFAGIARDDAFVSSIEVNGTPVDIRVIDAQVAFASPVLLAPGQNSVHVRIMDLAGNEYVEDVLLQNDLDGPAVSFDTPIALPGVLSGKVFDPSGVASLTIGDVQARLLDEGDGMASFEVSSVAAAGAVAFACSDTLGNTTQGEVPLAAPDTGDTLAPVALASRSSAHAAEFLGLEQLAATVVSDAPVEIRLENILEGASFYQDDIIVALNARSKEPIESVTLLGAKIAVVPARNDVYITRRVRLDQGPNTLDATIEDVQGNRATDERNVRREQNELEVSKNKLAVAIMAKSLPPDTLTDNIIGGLHSLRGDSASSGTAPQTLSERFDLVNRENLDTILREQELSAELSSPKRALALNQFIPFEVLLTLQANVDNGILEIIVDGVSSEKEVFVTGRVDVAGEATNAEGLIDQLIVRLLQEFPRAQGEVTFWSNPEIDIKLNEAQGARRHRKCLVYRLDTRNDGGIRPTIVAEGFITGTDAEQSSAELVKAIRGDDLSALELEKGHYAVLK